MGSISKKEVQKNTVLRKKIKFLRKYLDSSQLPKKTKAKSNPFQFRIKKENNSYE